MTLQSGSALESARAARKVGLVYVSDNDPGIRREKSGKGFRYFRPDAKPVKAKAELKRISSLAIPPAYRDVWICTEKLGHLQATGRDDRGRKQYRYHEQWRQVRDVTKFDRMVQFGKALPALRLHLKRDLARDGLPREKVLAVIVSLLDATRIRIGNAEYARDNHSFGLTTLRNRHVSFIRDGRARFQFKGKSGKEHEVVVTDRRIVAIVRNCQDLPGQQLFQFVGDDGQRHPVTSNDVNEYLQAIMGEDFTSKDFRTWHATLRAFMLLSAVPLPAPASERACRKEITTVVRQVAEELRNTPAVCRKSYINPQVFTAWRSGSLGKRKQDRTTLRSAELAVLAFLSRHPHR